MCCYHAFRRLIDHLGQCFRTALFELALGAVVAASLAARVFLAMYRPLWHDEVFTVWVSRLDIRQMIEVLRTDSGPPLFYLLEKPFVLAAEALHRSDKILRLLPLSASVLLIAGYRTLADRKSRLLFVLLCATSPLLLLYAADLAFRLELKSQVIPMPPPRTI